MALARYAACRAGAAEFIRESNCRVRHERPRGPLHESSIRESLRTSRSLPGAGPTNPARRSAAHKTRTLLRVQTCRPQREPIPSTPRSKEIR